MKIVNFASLSNSVIPILKWSKKQKMRMTIMIHNSLYDFRLAKIVNTLYYKLTIWYKGTPLYMVQEIILDELWFQIKTCTQKIWM